MRTSLAAHTDGDMYTFNVGLNDQSNDDGGELFVLPRLPKSYVESVGGDRGFAGYDS